MRRLYVAMLGLVMVFGWVEISSARQGAVPAALSRKARAQGTLWVIVELDTLSQGTAPGKQLTEAVITQQQKAITTTQDSVLAALKRTGARVTHQFTSIPYVALEATPSALRALEQSDRVIRVGEVRMAYPTLVESVPKVEADLAHEYGFNGTGQAVAILDTGVDNTHPDLRGRVVAEACFSTTSGNATSVCPGGVNQLIGPGAGINCNTRCEHGTHVAGIAAGARGVAPGANIIAIQVFHQEVNRPGFQPCVDSDKRPLPNGTSCVRAAFPDIANALNHIFHTLRNTQQIAAVNLSLGDSVEHTSQSECDADINTNMVKAAIDNLRAVGIATVVASGNEGYTNALASPACISSAISVGATNDTTDQVADRSNSAAFLSLLAPGQGITSSVPGGGTASMDGTSMATPHVAGAWAIMKQKAPAASVDKVLGALKKEGLPITDPKSGVTTPRIQILQALEVLADVYAKQSDPSCSNTDVIHSQTGWSGDWCNFVPSSRALDWCRQWVHPDTSAAWFGESKEDGSVLLGNRRCSLSVHCALPAGTRDVPYCDLATAVEKVPQGGIIGLMRGQSFKAPITLTKPSTLTAIDGNASIGQ